jgi:hypothetical protein
LSTTGHERTFFHLPALAQLTQFDLSGESNTIFYDNFKWDLLQLLDNAPKLAKVRIHRGLIEEDRITMYPEMLHRMQTIHLPTFAALHLSTRVIIFTAQELEVWGSRYGMAGARTFVNLSRYGSRSFRLQGSTAYFSVPHCGSLCGHGGY